MHSIDEYGDERSPLLSSESQISEPNDTNVAHKERQPTSSMALTITIAIFGVFLASADDAFVTATYSTIASEFHRNSDGPWLLLSYNLGYCYALPAYGSVSDTYGRKKPLIVAYCLFIIGCLISGTANTLDQAIAGRVVAGLGGAGMIALVSVIITGIVSPGQVAVLRSYVNIAAVLGKSVGAPLGGFLADIIGWKWSFGGQAPLALICLTAVTLKLEADPPRGPGEKVRGSGRFKALLRTMDWLGAILSALCITSGLGAISLGGKKLPWSHPIIILAITVCVMSAAFFVLTERYYARKPLIPPKLITHNGIGAMCVIQILLCAARFGSMAQVPSYFIRTRNVNNSIAGAYLVPTVLGNAVGALIGGYTINRTLRYKTITIAALVVGILGYLLMALRWRYRANAWESLYYVGGGFGYGMSLNAQFVGLTAAAPEEQEGTAIGVYYLSQQVGMIVGVGSFAALLETVFSNNLRRALGSFPGIDETIRDVLEDARLAALLPTKIQDAVLSAYLSSFYVIPISSMVCMALTLPIVLYLRERPLS